MLDVISIRRRGDVFHYSVQSKYSGTTTGYKHASQVRDRLWQDMNAKGHPVELVYYLLYEQSKLVVTSGLHDVRDVVFFGTPREIYDGILPHLQMMRAT